MKEGLKKIDSRAVQTRHTKAMEQAVLRVMRESASYTMGDEVKAFEKEFGELMGGIGVGVTSASAALELAATMSKVGPGDEVIVPAHTFVSSAVAFARRRARIVWADIDPDTRLMSADTVAPLITNRTKVIVVVHLYGLTVDMEPLMRLARKRKIVVVEDCAQAPGARYRGRRVGSFGDFGCFSFHTQKNITTLGEGGMLLCRREEDAVVARKLRWMGNWPFEGEREHYWLPAMGNLVCGLEGEWPFNFCLAEANAAVGRLELKRLDAVNAVRQRQAQRVIRGLARVPEISFQKVKRGCEHVYHLFSAQYNAPRSGANRNDLIRMLHDEYNIRCGVHYVPLYRTELFRAMGCGKANCPATDRYFDSMLGYPWWSDMPDAVLDHYVKSTREACARLRAGA